jgi:hypothetical protein
LCSLRQLGYLGDRPLERIAHSSRFYRVATPTSPHPRTAPAP